MIKILLQMLQYMISQNITLAEEERQHKQLSYF